MISNYPKAYSEILEYIYALPKNDFNKIPKEKIDFYEKYKDTSHLFSYNPALPLKEQNALRETKVILVSLYKDYFVDSEKKKTIEDILKLNGRKNNKEKEIKYSSVNIFDNNLKKDEEIIKENTEMIIREEKGILFKIKNIFKKIHDLFI